MRRDNSLRPAAPLSRRGVAFLLLLLSLNLRMAQRGIVPDAIVLRLGQAVPRGPQVDVTRALQRASLPVSLFLALLAGLARASAWGLVLRLIHATPFGIADPIFSRD